MKDKKSYIKTCIILSAFSYDIKQRDLLVKREEIRAKASTERLKDGLFWCAQNFNTEAMQVIPNLFHTGQLMQHNLHAGNTN